MIKKYYVYIVLAGLFCSSLISCSKDNGTNEICSILDNLHPHALPPLTQGDIIHLSIDHLEGTSYSWSGPNFYSTSESPTVTSSAYYTNRGMYYVELNHVGCTRRVDSIYVNVQFPQGTPPCSPTNNTATLSGIGTQLYTSTSFQAGGVGYEITGHSTDGDMVLKMSQYWLSHELEDGIYYTSYGIPQDSEIDKINITSHNQGNPYTYCYSDDDYPVYISHVGGKISVSFCGVHFAGYLWTGVPFTTNIEAKITQP